jgi:protoheme IX farnesyltransferase
VKNARADVASVSVRAGSHGTLGDYFSLTKPRLNVLVVAASAAGYCLGASSDSAAIGTPMLQTVTGTALVAAGSAVLNQLTERDTDALMRRTRGRALPDGRVPPADARLFGIILSVGGLALLAALPNLVAAGLALVTLILYLAVYTPLKRRTPLATVVGAVPGALPPLIGWTAASGNITAGGAALFAIMFLWQIPHFMAIAWMYRDDYAKAGFPMLPVIDPTGRRAGRQAVIYAAALIPVSALPTLAGVSGAAYLFTALGLGAILLWLAVRFAAARTERSAHTLFFASILYLPVLLVAMIANRL